MFAGARHNIQPEYRTRDQELRVRPYNAALTDLTSKLCTSLGLGASDVCLFETRVAFDCVLRHKVSKLGDMMDNIGACSNHIQHMKDNISKESGTDKDYVSILDNKLEELNYMRKSFV